MFIVQIWMIIWGWKDAQLHKEHKSISYLVNNLVS